MTEQKFPTEFIELPSKGHFYPEDNPLSSGKVEMKYMTAREEDILTSVNLINQGKVLDIDFSKIEKGHNTFSFTLPKTKRVLTFQLPTTKLEKNINNEIDAIKKVYKQSDVVEKNRSTRLKHQILSVDGNTDRAFINNFVDNEFLSIDVLEFRRYVNSISPDLQLQVEVDNSRGGKEIATVPITVGFFWPESRI